MEILGNQKKLDINQKNISKYYCESCDFKCSQKCDWEKHITRKKHLKNVGELVETSTKDFLCQCGKKFQTNAGLWKHKKTCTKTEETIDSDTEDTNKGDNISDKELILMLIKENSDFKNMMFEMFKGGTNNTHSHNTTTNSHNNSHNKTFNLQFFLNETCKDAMNIMDFVEQIVLNLNDLEETGRVGFAEGISKMITSRLKALDVTQRPIHCSDLKRETLYIKDENKWEKEEDDKPKLTKAVKKIAGKNMNQIFDWQKAHPDFKDSDSRTSDRYMKMLTNVMSGGTEEETQENYEKIIKNIVKETTIDKDKFLV